jgi:O-acetylserine/cysteine efflux transporter
MIKPLDMLRLLALMAVWGLSFVAIKLAVLEGPPLFMAALRFSLTCLPAVFFLKKPNVNWSYLIGYGVSLGVIQFGLLFMSIHLGMPAGLASLLMQLQAFFSIGLAVLIFKDVPHAYGLGGAVLALIGVAIIGSERLGGASLLPLCLVIAAAFGWSLANIIAKQAGHKTSGDQKIDMLSFVAWGSLFAPLPLFGLSLMFEGEAAVHALTHPTLMMWGSSLYLAIIATLGGFSLWGELMSRYPTATIAPFSLLAPVFGFVYASLIFHEPITRLEVIGATIIALGLGLNVYGPRLMARFTLNKETT